MWPMISGLMKAIIMNLKLVYRSIFNILCVKGCCKKAITMKVKCYLGGT
jgi:hypothetical protein